MTSPLGTNDTDEDYIILAIIIGAVAALLVLLAAVVFTYKLCRARRYVLLLAYLSPSSPGF